LINSRFLAYSNTKKNVLLIVLLALFSYNRHMNTIQKLLADIQRIKKHERSDNGGAYDGQRVCMQICKLFETSNRSSINLARSISDYWFNTYVMASDNLSEEPSEENLNRITAFQSFLDGDDDGEYDVLNSEDWENLRDFVNLEAEDLDLDFLQSMMSIILSHDGI